MDRIECSVWNNGGGGWGLKILGGLRVRAKHFRRTQNPILVELEGTLLPVNIDKKSFWTGPCGELINVDFRDWIAKTRLATGDRVWLEIVEPYRRFRIVRTQVSAKEVA